MGDNTSERLFLALWPDEQVQQELHAVVQALAPVVRGRQQLASQRHVTLVFLGNVSAPDKQKLIDLCSSITATRFELVLDKIVWRQRQGIVWLEASESPQELLRLVRELSGKVAQLGVALEDRPFIAHVTLYRHSRAVKRIPELAAPVHWDVTSFALVRSNLTAEGANYENLCKWELR